jgi:hypothetical protein
LPLPQALWRAAGDSEVSSSRTYGAGQDPFWLRMDFSFCFLSLVDDVNHYTGANKKGKHLSAFAF